MISRKVLELESNVARAHTSLRHMSPECNVAMRPSSFILSHREGSKVLRRKVMYLEQKFNLVKKKKPQELSTTHLLLHRLDRGNKHNGASRCLLNLIS
jgi:hypothetical protein